MKLIDLIDDMEVKKWVLIFCILGVSFTDNVGDIKLAEVFSLDSQPFFVERRGFGLRSPFRGLHAPQACRFSHSCLFPS